MFPTRKKSKKKESIRQYIGMGLQNLMVMNSHLLLFQLEKLIPPKYGSDNRGKLHSSKVLADACPILKHKAHEMKRRSKLRNNGGRSQNVPWSPRERIECPLHLLLITFEPSLRSMRRWKGLYVRRERSKNPCQKTKFTDTPQQPYPTRPYHDGSCTWER